MTTQPMQIDPRFAESLYRSLVHDAFAGGHLSEADLADPEMLLPKLLDLLQHSNFSLVVDHRNSILESAVAYHEQKELNYSLLFYAMFFEHTLNHLIYVALTRKKMRAKTISAVIRAANMEGKLSWLLELMELPAFNERHRRVILAIANERNAFVHYKWDPDSNDLKVSRTKSQRLGELLVSARRAATYLRSYESKFVFRSMKNKVGAATRRRPNNSSKPTPLRGAA